MSTTNPTQSERNERIASALATSQSVLDLTTMALAASGLSPLQLELIKVREQAVSNLAELRVYERIGNIVQDAKDRTDAKRTIVVEPTHVGTAH